MVGWAISLPQTILSTQDIKLLKLYHITGSALLHGSVVACLVRSSCGQTSVRIPHAFNKAAYTT